MPDGVTKVTITRDMATRTLKHMDDYTMPPEDATREDILAYRYLMWKDTEKLRIETEALARRLRMNQVRDAQPFPPRHLQTRPRWCKEEDAIGHDCTG